MADELGRISRLRLLIRGRVQGVGFRPALYWLARQQDLSGTIANSGAGVVAELEGTASSLDRLREGLLSNLPAHAQVEEILEEWLPASGADSIQILPSEDRGAQGARIPADLALCKHCLGELIDPTDRRHGYAFINCTACGPRFTIVESLPYDRPRTSMAPFAMCARCAEEYGDPEDRRYHAEPTACSTCGPTLELVDRVGARLPGGDPLATAVASLARGEVVAVKGLGGFHLAVDARDQQAVLRLRERKGRQHKPFAVMVRDLDEARLHGEVDARAEELLSSSAAPIVVLLRSAGSGLAEAVAPGSPLLGLMLPYTPLHCLLLEHVPALVLTSGNLSEEPIAVGNGEARQRLGAIADAFLQHDREILVACEDSVVGLVGDGPMFLRRSRGYVPDPLRLPWDAGQILATGAELKNTFCLTRGREAFLGPHVGDLSSPESYDAYTHALEHMQRLLRLRPESVACDLHPDYLSTRYARESGLPVHGVQHHHAHLAAVVGDRGLTEPVLGLALDGTGYGEDGTIWGGELLLLPHPGRFTRLGHLRSFALPGGEACVRRPARTALGLVGELLGEERFGVAADLMGVGAEEAGAVQSMLRRDVACVRTTSVGRLFDGVAALCGLGQPPTFEGQPAMALEHLAGNRDLEPLPMEVSGEEPYIIDPAPALEEILASLQANGSKPVLAARFHSGLVEALTRACCQASAATGVNAVVLGGGCWQNRLLVRLLCARLTRSGLRAYLPRRVPPNDGGLALGQAVAHATNGL